MNRRGFVGMIGAALTAGAVGVKASAPVESDDFMYRGYRIRWNGWTVPVNQIVQIGFWIAILPDQAGFIASTTLGNVDRYSHETHCVALFSSDKSWPMLTAFATDSEKAAVKTRALDALKATL